MLWFEQRNSFLPLPSFSLAITELLLKSCQHILYKFNLETDRPQLKIQKGVLWMDWDLQVVRREEGQIHKVSAKIIDDSFSYEGMGPIGVFAQTLGVLFTVLWSFIWNSKDELHRKVAQSGLSWHYFFRFITALSLQTYI